MAKCRFISRERANVVTLSSYSDMICAYYQSTHASDGVTVIVSVVFQKFVKES